MRPRPDSREMYLIITCRLDKTSYDAGPTRAHPFHFSIHPKLPVIIPTPSRYLPFPSASSIYIQIPLIPSKLISHQRKAIFTVHLPNISQDVESNQASVFARIHSPADLFWSGDWDCVVYSGSIFFYCALCPTINYRITCSATFNIIAAEFTSVSARLFLPQPSWQRFGI